MRTKAFDRARYRQDGDPHNLDPLSCTKREEGDLHSYDPHISAPLPCRRRFIDTVKCDVIVLCVLRSRFP